MGEKCHGIPPFVIEPDFLIFILFHLKSILLYWFHVTNNSTNVKRLAVSIIYLHKTQIRLISLNTWSVLQSEMFRQQLIPTLVALILTTLIFPHNQYFSWNSFLEQSITKGLVPFPCSITWIPGSRHFGCFEVIITWVMGK